MPIFDKYNVSLLNKNINLCLKILTDPKFFNNVYIVI